MTIRVNWQAIKNGMSVNADAQSVLVLPEGGRRLLMASIDHLKWRATYRVSDYDFSDWDYLQSIVEATHYGLMDGEPVTTIAEALEYIGDKIGELDMSVVNNNNLCCCGSGGTSNGAPGLPEPGVPVSPGEVDNSIPQLAEEPQTSEFREYTCNLSHMMTYYLRYNAMRITELMAIGDAEYQRLQIELEGVWTLLQLAYELAWETFYVIVSWLVNLSSNSAAQSFADAIDRNYDRFVCAFVNGDGVDGKIQNVTAVIESLPLNFAERYWLRLILEQLPVQAFYRTDWEAYQFPVSWQNRTCDCGISVPPYEPPTTLPIAPDGYSIIPVVYTTPLQNDDRTLGWGNITFSSFSNEATFTYSQVDGNNAGGRLAVGLDPVAAINNFPGLIVDDIFAVIAELPDYSPDPNHWDIANLGGQVNNNLMFDSRIEKSFLGGESGADFDVISNAGSWDKVSGKATTYSWDKFDAQSLASADPSSITVTLWYVVKGLPDG